MRDRYFRSATRFFKFSPALLRLRLLPAWVMLSLSANAILLVMLLASLPRQTAPQAATMPVTNAAPPSPQESNLGQSASNQSAQFGTRQQLTYEQWLDQLKQEAKVATEQKPDRLTVLAGDSISLWFPNDLLPEGRTWLNQGISGETSAGLLKRLSLFDQTEPETIFVMIGINDLLRNVSNQTADQELLENQRQIITALKKDHPQSQIVVQSILPHAAESVWEGRDRLLALSNQRIQEINEQLETLARQEGVYFLDLYPLFADPQGDLRPELSTDGLHLSPMGYQTWKIALQVYSREVLEVD